MQRPYFESVRDVYIRAACDLYKHAINADGETADASQFIARGDELRNSAREMWTVTTRQENRMAGLRARAELNTPEGREKRDRIIASLKAEKGQSLLGGQTKNFS